jgi:hypothetical protein
MGGRDPRRTDDRCDGGENPAHLLGVDADLARRPIETGVQRVCAHARQQIKDRRLRCRVRHGFFPFVG